MVLPYDKEKSGYALEMLQQLYAIKAKASEENLPKGERHELSPHYSSAEELGIIIYGAIFFDRWI